jgi:sialate O-acetylesterase
LKQAAAERKNAASAYRTNQLPKALVELEHWIAATRIALAKGEAPTPAPVLPGHPGASGWCSMFNAMINPLARFPVKGALWYQGESNGGGGGSYYDKMRAPVGGWRKLWEKDDLPFYFVQVASFQGANDNPAGGDGWARLRSAQARSLAIPHTGMAVIIDTVPLAEAGNIHPVNKYDVGMRLARWALARDYGQKELEVSGPLFREMKIENGKAKLFFDHVASGLMVGKKEGVAPAVEDTEGGLKRFAIAGADKKWQWADAVIDGDAVVVSSPAVAEPVAVRYAFSHNPAGANLYNRDGLPASPFRTDDW